VRRAARFSPDRRYRYVLTRRWDRVRPVCAFVLLNPSTADERADDPTVRRCAAFARRWGFGGLTLVNLFALRATEPRALRDAPDPVGRANDVGLLRQTRRAAVVVLGWGAHGRLRGRAEEVRSLLSPLSAKFRILGRTRSGEPRHPLYLAGDSLLTGA
jgi:hypothetical protein